MAAVQKRNWWYRPQSAYEGQKESTIKDVDFYFDHAGGLPRQGEKFRIQGDRIENGYMRTVLAVDEIKKQFVYEDKGVKKWLWLDWMHYEPKGPEVKETIPRAKKAAKPRQKTPSRNQSGHKGKKKKRSSSADEEQDEEDRANDREQTDTPGMSRDESGFVKADWVDNPRDSYDRYILDLFRKQADNYK